MVKLEMSTTALELTPIASAGRVNALASRTRYQTKNIAFIFAHGITPKESVRKAGLIISTTDRYYANTMPDQQNIFKYNQICEYQA